MTTSGVTTFSMNRNALINAAHRKLGVLADGVFPSDSQTTNASEALNSMLKLFQVKGMPLWAMSETTVPLTTSSTYRYGIGQTINVPAPLKVIAARITETSSGTQVPLKLSTRDEFNRLNTTTQTGKPVSFWYEPLNQVGILHLWPIPDNVTIATHTVKFIQQRPLEDMVNSTDTLDFPQWWTDAIIYGLAMRLASEFGVPLNDREILAKEAEHYLNEALSFGGEEGSFYFSPESRK